jgi:hypothetical protein
MCPKVEGGTAILHVHIRVSGTDEICISGKLWRRLGG